MKENTSETIPRFLHVILHKIIMVCINKYKKCTGGGEISINVEVGVLLFGIG